MCVCVLAVECWLLRCAVCQAAVCVMCVLGPAGGVRAGALWRREGRHQNQHCKERQNHVMSESCDVRVM